MLQKKKSGPEAGLCSQANWTGRCKETERLGCLFIPVAPFQYQKNWVLWYKDPQSHQPCTTSVWGTTGISYTARVELDASVWYPDRVTAGTNVRAISAIMCH